MKRQSTLSKYKAALFCLFPVMLYANDLPKWEILPAQSNITFTAIQNNAPISGQFKRFTGEIAVDPKRYESSQINITIDMTSLSASYHDLVTMLLSADWFDVSRFPSASFKATRFNKINENTYTAAGTLTIRNKTVPVTLTFTAEENDRDYTVVQGNTTIKRTAFGVGQGEWADVSSIKDEVQVNFKVTAQKINLD
ncbi:putative YceI-like family protein [Legionella beliardensis]|uniref:Putative YceI-like family protein n=1 Tax=Legionella beliardensis TaxID=91822 RepID=A0A378HZD2_9GAMM|nr:YceI family protein [Legionella beliardensis]STX28112.1 putative YceI-like family protein [Legionella beliardensis]